MSIFPADLRILIDVQGVQGPFNDRGVARTVAELSCALVRIGAPVVGMLLNPNLPVPPDWFPELCNQPTLQWATPARLAALQTGGPTVCLLPSPMEGSEPVDGVWPPFLATTPFVPLIHDAIPYADPVAYDIRHADRQLHRTRPLWLEHAAHTLATTRFAAKQWQQLVAPELVIVDASTGGSIAAGAPTAHAWITDAIPVVAPRSVAGASAGGPVARRSSRSISVIGMGVSDFFRPAANRADARTELTDAIPAITKPFVLYVGGDDERKNVDGAIRAWAGVALETRQTRQFVVACSASDATRSTWEAVAADAGLRARDVVITGFVRNETLRVLYQTAELHFFASLSEGFGMPIVEAIASGCPVISSNTTSMPEIVGWEPGMFDPTDVEAMSRLVTRALVDERYRAQLQHACQASLGQHTWDAAARRAVQALADHVRIPASTSKRRGVRRLAIVGPIGDHPVARQQVQQLVDDLLAAYPKLEIDVFGDRAATSDVGRVGHYPTAAFGRTLSPGGYDERVYMLVDSPECAPVYQAACQWPGVAWLSDGRLSRLMAGTLSTSAFAGFVQRWYGDRVPSKVRYATTPQPDLLDDHRLLCTAEIVQRSTRTLVFDAESAQSVVLDAGPWSSPSVEVLPADAERFFVSLAT